MPNRNQITLKMLLVGPSESGKTALLTQYVDQRFPKDHISTIGIDFKIKESFPHPREPVDLKLQIWDTAGHERFRTITQAYYRSALCFLAVFDITKKASFNALPTFIKPDLVDYSSVILVGNKSDEASDRQVSPEEIAELVKKLGLHSYVELSAKDKSAVNQLFTSAALLAYEKSGAKPKPIPIDILSHTEFVRPAKSKKSNCCSFWSCCNKPMDDESPMPEPAYQQLI